MGSWEGRRSTILTSKIGVPHPPSPITIAKRHLVTRLEEAEREKDDQENIERVNTCSANLLTFGQYIVGGVLASSFVQQSLTPNIIGLLGLLVLLSSIVKQQYHPDVRARIAGQKVARLRALIRETNDRLVAIKTAGESEDDVKAVLALVTKLTSVLNEMDAYHLPLPGEKALAGPSAEKKPQRPSDNPRNVSTSCLLVRKWKLKGSQGIMAWQRITLDNSINQFDLLAHTANPQAILDVT